MKVFTASIKVLDDDRRLLQTIISTGSVDRDKDTIDPRGWDLTAYRRSPTVLWMHDHKTPPIARSPEITVAGGQLRSIDEFPPKGLYPFADTIYDLAKAGFINAKSVGFIPLTWAYNEQRGGIDYFTQELTEHSYVSVGANAEALVVARSKAFDSGAVWKWAQGVRAGREDCPAGPERCANVDNSDVCPARGLCPMLGAVSGQRHFLTLDGDEEVNLVEADLREAFTLAEAEIRRHVMLATREEMCRRLGRID